MSWRAISKPTDHDSSLYSEETAPTTVPVKVPVKPASNPTTAKIALAPLPSNWTINCPAFPAASFKA